MSDTIEYIYIGRLWVLPFSRQYEFHDDGGRILLTGGAIDSDCFTTKQLERLTPGGRYMCEFESEPSERAVDDPPVLLYIRSEKGEPL